MLYKYLNYRVRGVPTSNINETSAIASKNTTSHMFLMWIGFNFFIFLNGYKTRSNLNYWLLPSTMDYAEKHLSKILMFSIVYWEIKYNINIIEMVLYSLILR